jgi:hypothetical protein
MNGWDDDFEAAFGPQDEDEWRAALEDGLDMDDGPVDCPYCGHPLGGEIPWYCGDCDVQFAGREDVQCEWATLAAEGWAR